MAFNDTLKTSSTRPPPPLLPPPLAPASPMMTRKYPETSLSHDENQIFLPKCESPFNKGIDNQGQHEIVEDLSVQIHKQKCFLQTILKDKEKLANICAHQAAKVSKLEADKKDWQHKFIEVEGEKRDLIERIEQEGRQTLKKVEKQKRDYEKLQVDSINLLKERNDAVSQLSNKMKELDELEIERRDLYSRIDILEREKKENTTSESRAEINNIKIENDKCKAEIEKLNKEKQDFWAETQKSIESLKQKNDHFELMSVKYGEDLKEAKRIEADSKIQLIKLKKENVILSDKLMKSQTEHIEYDKKVRSVNEELKDLKAQIDHLEKLNVDVKGSLSKSENSKDLLEKQLSKLSGVEKENKVLLNQISECETRSQNEITNLKQFIDRQKKSEIELNTLIMTLKSTIEKYEAEKKKNSLAEKTRRDSTLVKIETEKKELEEKFFKMKLQFEKIAIESKRKMSQLEEDKSMNQSWINDSKALLEKKEEENKTLSKKLSSLNNDFNKFKSSSKLETNKLQKDAEELENRLNEARRNLDCDRKKLSTSDAKVARLMEQKRDLEKSILKLENDIQSKSSHLHDVEKAKENMETVLKETKERLKEKERETVDLNQVLKDLKIDLEKVHICNEHEKQIQSQAAEIQRIQKVNEELERNITKCRSEADQLQRTNESAISKLSWRIDQLQEEIKKKDRDITTRDKSHQSLIQEKSILEKKYKALQEKLQTKSSNRNNDLQVLEKEKNRLNESIATLKSSLSLEKRQVQDLKDKIQSHENEGILLKSETLEEKKRLEEQLTRLEETNTKQNDLIFKLQGELKGIEKVKHAFENRFAQGDKYSWELFKKDLVQVEESVDDEKIINITDRILQNLGKQQRACVKCRDLIAKKSESNENLLQAQSNLNMTVEKLKSTELELCQIKEKNAQLSDELLNKSRQLIQMNSPATEDKKGKVKKSVTFASGQEDRIKQLEEALEEAHQERQEIIESAQREIEYHRSIAAELEQTMIDDFEWKLHEIESEYNKKLDALMSDDDNSLLDAKLIQVKNRFNNKKDEQVERIRSQLKKEMDDMLRLERNSFKTAIDNDHCSEKKEEELQRSIQALHKSNKDLTDKINGLNKQLKTKDDEILEIQTSSRREKDIKVLEECDKIRGNYESQIIQIHANYDNQIEDLKERLEMALGTKLEHMLALREEVEQEYADKMETLRLLYKDEMTSQLEGFNKEKERLTTLEMSLQKTLKLKRNEIDEFKKKETEHNNVIKELSKRLEDQTSEVMRLQSQLEEYEYEDAIEVHSLDKST